MPRLDNTNFEVTNIEEFAEKVEKEIPIDLCKV